MNTPRSFRATELAKELSRQGHYVFVLTQRSNEQICLEKDYNITFFNLQVEQSKALHSLNFFSACKIINRISKRIQNQFFDYPNILLKNLVFNRLIELDIQRFDALVSIAVPHSIHWGVAKFWKSNNRSKKPIWIADCGDPFMLADSSKDYFKPFYFKYFEKQFCRLCTFITVPAEESINGYYKEFHKKIKVIPQGFRFEDVNTHVQQLTTNSEIEFAYAGSLNNHSRNPAPFILFINKLNIKYKFHIFTNEKSIVHSINQLERENVILHDIVDRIKLLSLMSKLDFVVNFENHGKNHVPSKLIDYAIINKPILSIKSYDLNEKKVKEFMMKDYKNALNIENIDQYRIENVVRSFLDLMNK